MKRPIGIDISCLTLDYYVSNQTEQLENGIFQNTQIDITLFLKKYPPDCFYLVIEPTGTYGDKLVEIAHSQGFEIRLANPKKSSKFMEVLDLMHKTDKNAAMALCLMGQSKEITLPRFIPPSDLLKQRKQIQITLNGLLKQHNMTSNQIHAMEQRLNPSELSQSALKAIKNALEEQIRLLEKELQQLSDKEIEEFSIHAQSVVGIGPKS